MLPKTSLSCPSFVAISQQWKHFGEVPAVVVCGCSPAFFYPLSKLILSKNRLPWLPLIQWLIIIAQWNFPSISSLGYPCLFALSSRSPWNQPHPCYIKFVDSLESFNYVEHIGPCKSYHFGQKCIHTYIHTYINTYIHKYIHTYIHTYI